MNKLFNGFSESELLIAKNISKSMQKRIDIQSEVAVNHAGWCVEVWTSQGWKRASAIFINKDVAENECVALSICGRTDLRVYEALNE